MFDRHHTSLYQQVPFVYDQTWGTVELFARSMADGKVVVEMFLYYLGKYYFKAEGESKTQRLGLSQVYCYSTALPKDLIMRLAGWLLGELGWQVEHHGVCDEQKPVLDPHVVQCRFLKNFTMVA